MSVSSRKITILFAFLLLMLFPNLSPQVYLNTLRDQSLLTAAYASDIPTGTSYLLWEHHGGMWCDAEKQPPDDGEGVSVDPTDPAYQWGYEDDHMCWAAAASNVLEWTGWGLTGALWTTDEIFDEFKTYWGDAGILAVNGWRWWFDASEPNPPINSRGVRYVDVPGGGAYWPAYDIDDYMFHVNNRALILSQIDTWLNLGYGVVLVLKELSGSGEHSVTCWGFNYDPAANKMLNPEEYYLGVWLTDSIDDKETNPAPNVLRYYEVEWSGTQWIMPNLYRGYSLKDVMALKPFPSERPVASFGPLTTLLLTEGASITLNASYSSDADGDPLQYRWDTNNDGVWTPWSTSATHTNSWGDDYSGLVAVQVYDGHLLDVTTINVTVANVAPSVNAWASQSGDVGDIVEFSGAFVDPGTNDTHIITWDFGDGSILNSTSITALTTWKTYDEEGIYTVTLTVRDDDGGIGTDTLTVTVAHGGTLSLEDVTAWFWTDDTRVNAVAVGDVDSGGSVEVVTAGYYFDNTRECAQLVVWNGTTLAVEGVRTWYWTDDTRINAVAIGNVDEDDALEIVTAGSYFDGLRKVAQLVVWDGATLAVDGLTTWYWTDNTAITTVQVADVDGDGAAEIVTGGYYDDGLREVAQLVVWNGTTFTVENVAAWYWTGDTRINAVAIGNVDGDAALEIVTGGYYTDAQRIAQLVVWDVVTLSPDHIAAWYWTSDTEVTAVEAANVDADVDLEIVTGGYYHDLNRDVAQLVVWSHDLQTVENVATWYWTSDTRIKSLCTSDVDGDAEVEIITGGSYHDGVREVAQLVVWDGTTLAVDYLTGWYWTSDTCICSVEVGNADGDVSTEIITGGYFHDGFQQCAQTTLWEIS